MADAIAAARARVRGRARGQFSRLFAARPSEAALSQVDTALLPLTPADYVRLRREAAGLTIRQVAERIEPRIAVRGDIARLLAMLERPGASARTIHTLVPLKRAFPIDLEVYQQLRDTPAKHHPSVCRVCGCSQSDPCLTDDHSCCTLRHTSCSRCIPEDDA